ncbi:hypothetical protein J2848_005175 [Azospirillum lipoferum]|uniref:recombinase family protein n=1 Tax=Azospirillum TaxID=191 RepID=UPI001FED1B3A|nr:MULTISPECIES: recombinase family protein [Azospirillum]MCP1613479.1 hypothetical protein [Azospirillum lipoferum]MDW5533086.1 recombinase family protein [Azospirillum sp. NL1]
MSEWQAARGPPQRGFPYSHPDLKACLAFLKSGDTLVVWKFHRLGRSSPHLLDIVTDLRDSAYRVLVADRGNEHEHATWSASVPYLFGACPI